MSKLDLLSILEENPQPKQKFQLFEAELGFERIEVLIPFENSDAFENEASSHTPKSVNALKKLAAKFGGTPR